MLTFSEKYAIMISVDIMLTKLRKGSKLILKSRETMKDATTKIILMSMHVT